MSQSNGPNSGPSPETAQPAHLLDPMRSDAILSLMFRLSREKPWLLAAVWLVVSFGGMLLLAWIKGVAFSNGATPSKELFEDYGNLVNIGVVVPLGIFLVCNLYKRMQEGIIKLINDGLVSYPSAEERNAHLKELDEIINRPWFFAVSLLLSIALNLWIGLNLTGAWNEMSNGLPAYWFRLCAVFNFYMVFHVLLKSFAAVRMIHRFLDRDLQLQPLHPDRCSGLAAIGRISGAINLFLALITLYITTLVALDGIPLTHPLFLSVVAGFLGLATYLFVSPLARTHKMMVAQRDAVLNALNHEFHRHFQNMAQQLQASQGVGQDVESSLALEDIQRMEILEKLHQIAYRMPTWPIKMDSLTKFFAVGIGPIAVAVAKAMLK